MVLDAIGTPVLLLIMNNNCNLELYQRWYDQPFQNRLSDTMLLALIQAQRKDKRIWEIMKFDSERENFFSGRNTISNGQVMELSSNLCRRSLSLLEESLAGNHAPINERNIHDVMCSNECLLNDRLRFLSMNISKCACMELSIQHDSDLFKAAGSFCKENSAEYLCTDLAKCGKWQCDISDYGCKRIEYNQQEIPLKGNGGDCSGASKYNFMHRMIFWIFLFTTMFVW